MIKIKILFVGKTKEKWLEEACSEYLKRLSPVIQVYFAWARDTPQLIDWAQKEESIISLDPKGETFTSEEFSHYLAGQWEKQGGRLTLIIGGAEGLPKEIKERGNLISLSSLTFTHQITRLILIEQIYRASEIQKGSSYHK